MKFVDSIYSCSPINEPVLIDLLQTRAMQRLQGVYQHGVTAILGITQPVTRYEHSLGVWHLVKRFGGSLEEQITALIHDVSHSVFSHVIDYLADGRQITNFHDEYKEFYVAGTELPEVLGRYGELKKISIESFSILKRIQVTW